MKAMLERLGFDAGRLSYGLRTALGACVAVALAWTLGFDHPHWAGMSVWAAAQPMRGALLEKSLMRMLGTIVGTGVGVLLVLLSTLHLAVMVAGLVLWITLCTWGANIQRGTLSYGMVLAGYSAAMVSLLDVGNPEHVLPLGFDRLATVLTGVLVGCIVSYVWAQPSKVGDMRRQVMNLLAEVLRLRAGDGGAPGQLLSRMAVLDEMLDLNAAGSLASQRSMREARRALLSAVPLVGQGLTPPCAGDAMRKAADALAAGRPGDAAALLDAAGCVELDAFSEALRGCANGQGDAERLPDVRVHRDRPGAREAALRAFVAMSLFGCFWLATGWEWGGFMLLGLSVMISLFSTFEAPARFMRSVCQGQILGIIAMLACRWLLWPLADAEWQLIVMMMPFIMFGGLLVAHRGTLLLALDYNMLLLLLTQPSWPLSGTFGQSVMMALAVLSGPLMAMGAYALIFPTDLARRADHVRQMMLRDVMALAGRDDAMRLRKAFVARMSHRALRLVRLTERLGQGVSQPVEDGRTAIELTAAVLRSREIMEDMSNSATLRRVARSALGRLARLDADPAAARAALQRLGARLSGADGALMLEAAEGLPGLARA